MSMGLMPYVNQGYGNAIRAYSSMRPKIEKPKKTIGGGLQNAVGGGLSGMMMGPRVGKAFSGLGGGAEAASQGLSAYDVTQTGVLMSPALKGASAAPMIGEATASGVGGLAAGGGSAAPGAVAPMLIGESAAVGGGVGAASTGAGAAAGTGAGLVATGAAGGGAVVEGATVGAAGGPWGAAIGAGIGAAIGLASYYLS